MKQKKRIKIAISILIVMILLLAIVMANLPKEETEAKIPTEITSVEELLAYYQCQEIQIRKSPEELFQTDIYLTFGEDLWLEGHSNEIYYQCIVRYLTPLLQYQSYRMIDSSRELVVAVIADADSKTIKSVYINGETNYFAKEETKQQIGTYQKMETTEMDIQAKEIQNYIQQDWNPRNVSLGTLESRFEDYDIYFDEGIQVKTIAGRVYNLVFTEKYSSPIVDSLMVNSTREQIVQALGTPNFEQEDVIGYKGEKIYVFFSENAISVYPREKNYQTEEFVTLWEAFQNTKDAKTFVGNLTELWKDYSAYQYDSNYIYLEYALRGIRIQFNVNGENGILLYQNYEGMLSEGLTLETITAENLPEHVYLHMEEDLVFQNELGRVLSELRYSSEDMYIITENTFLEEEYGETFRFTDRGSNLFYLEYAYIPEEGIREVKFISKDRNYPNSELIRHKQINTYGWLNDEQFVYSVRQEGIYYYNAKTRVLRALITGKEEFTLKKIEGNTLYYDETSMKLN